MYYDYYYKNNVRVYIVLKFRIFVTIHNYVDKMYLFTLNLHFDSMYIHTTKKNLAWI